MIKAGLAFNGSVTVTLTPETEKDKALLALAFNGQSVQRIKIEENGSIILELGQAEEPHKVMKIKE